MKLSAIILLWSAVVCHKCVSNRDPLTQQVDRLLSRVQMPRERLRVIQMVLRDLELVLNTVWPGSRVLVLGSVVLELATVTSDVDYTVLLPHRRDTTQSLMDHVQATLQNYPHIFTNLHPVTATLPVVAFVHSPTQLYVDLTVNNNNALQTSNLFNYLLGSDETLHKFAFIVKHWAYKQRLTYKHTLSNYGMLLMVIFYLQQMKMLPSIAALQADVNPHDVKGWNIAFREIPRNVKLKIPLESLLGGFFEFYDQFDYDGNIVSPYTGDAIEKRLFNDLNTVPKEFSRYCQNVRANISTPLTVRNGILVQEVFEHNVNVAKEVDNEAFFKLKANFKHAAEKFKQNATAFLDALFNQ